MTCSCKSDFNLFKKVGRQNSLRYFGLSIAFQNPKYLKVIFLHTLRDTVSIKRLICKIIGHRNKKGSFIDSEGVHDALICERCYKLIEKFKGENDVQEIEDLG